jgi:hypothetical protein
MKLTFVSIILFFSYNITFSQSLSFDFFKNFTAYSEYELIDELNEIGFSLLNSNSESTRCNKTFSRQYFSNKPERRLSGEIGIVVLRKEKDLFVEIDYGSDFDNWENIGAKIDTSFILEKSFYSSKYKCKVNKYSYNKFFYYAYVDQQVEGLTYPSFIISNFRIDECYFSN